MHVLRRFLSLFLTDFWKILQGLFSSQFRDIVANILKVKTFDPIQGLERSLILTNLMGLLMDVAIYYMSKGRTFII